MLTQQSPTAHFQRRNTLKATLFDCVDDIRGWMLTNSLMINDKKTEVMLVGTPQQLTKITPDGWK